MICDIEVDAMGLLCPLPVLKARKKLNEMALGQRLLLRATDRAAVVDIPHYCNGSGDILIWQRSDEKSDLYLIEKGPRAL